MLFSNTHTSKKPREEHVIKVKKVIACGKFMSPDRIMKASGLSLTAVKCVLEDLYQKEMLEIIRQEVSPKLQVKIRQAIKNEDLPK